MKKKWIIFSIGVVGALLVYVGMSKFSQKNPFTTQTTEKKEGQYFCSTLITKWNDGQCPCLPIQINSREISCLLDLGFRGHFSISKEILDEINDKTYLGSQKMYGFQGNQYEKKTFRLPKVQIGSMSFYRSTVQERAENFHIDATIVQEDKATSSSESGKIGWEIFKAANLLLDLGNATVAFCDSLSTLKQHGYAVDAFTETPLISERGLIEIAADTSNGHLLCVLDTGSTWNILNASPERGMDELNRHQKGVFEMPLFQIAEKKLSPMTFHYVPIQLPIHVEAILGMDFFVENIVFLDFTNNLVYLAPSSKNKAKNNCNHFSDK